MPAPGRTVLESFAGHSFRAGVRRIALTVISRLCAYFLNCATLRPGSGGWWQDSSKGKLSNMNYAALLACGLGVLIVAPVGASAAEGVPGGMSYGFQRGSEIAGPVIGGIPGAVVGGVTGGVEGVLGIEHRPNYVAVREEYRPIHRTRHIVQGHHRHNHRY